METRAGPFLLGVPGDKGSQQSFQSRWPVGWSWRMPRFLLGREVRGHRLRKQRVQWQNGLKVLVRMGKEVQSQVAIDGHRWC